MKFSEIKEGIKMPNNPSISTENYTIGFEFELYVKDEAIYVDYEEEDEDGNIEIVRMDPADIESYGEDDPDDEFERMAKANEEFDDYNYELYGTPTVFIQWWEDEASNDISILNLVHDWDIMPRFGYSDTTHENVYTDETKSDTANLEEIAFKWNLFKEYMDVSAEEMMTDYVGEGWDDFFSNKLSEAFGEWWDENSNTYNKPGTKLGYVKDIIRDTFGSATNFPSSHKWAVVSDSTVGVEAEIVTPVFLDLKTGIQSMRRVFQIIRDDEYLISCSSCGLHVNIGTWKGDEYKKIDWLKFLIAYRGDYALKQFSREFNKSYAEDRLKPIVDALIKGVGDTNYKSSIDEINAVVLDKSYKTSAVNLSKLETLGYIEIRAPGNFHYELKEKEMIVQINRVVQALKIASDPKLFHKQYINALHSIAKKPELNSKSRQDSPFVKYAVSQGINPHSMQGEIEVVAALLRSHSTNIASLNKGFTIGVYNDLVSLITTTLKYNTHAVTYTSNLLKRTLKERPDLHNANIIKMLFKNFPQFKEEEENTNENK
jgi:hypothetical protein